MKYQFSNPHPGGISGALKPLPTEVKFEIDLLDGTSVTLGTAIRRILLAAARDARAGRLNGSIKLTERLAAPGTGRPNMLCMEEALAGGASHNWRLLDYVPLEHSQQSGKRSSRG